MQKRSREINVFSISALDLFAAALGAFILMALIFMVFFSMTSRDSGDGEDKSAELEEAHAALAQARADLASARDDAASARAEAAVARAKAASASGALGRCEEQVEGSVAAESLEQCRADAAARERENAALADQLATVRIPPIDVVICLDITGSMHGQIESLKQEIRDLARVLDRLADSAGIGVVAYGDVVYRRPIHRHPIVPTSSLSSLHAFVNSLAPELGNDDENAHGPPEAVGLGLAEAVRANWRAESERRYIIVVTDAPAYEHRLEYAYGLARDFAAADNHFVSGVMVGYGAERFLRRLAQEGRGQFVNDVGGQSMLASVLLAIVDA